MAESELVLRQGSGGLRYGVAYGDVMSDRRCDPC